MTKDLNKNVLQIQYNLLNLPSMITFNSSSNYKFVYDATGRKLSATFGMEGSIIGPIHSFPHGSSLSGEVNAVASVVSLFRGGHITQYRSFGNGFFGGLLGDPINTVQNQTGRYSQGTIIPVFVGNSFSHSIKDIIAAFHRNAKLR